MKTQSCLARSYTEKKESNHQIVKWRTRRWWGFAKGISDARWETNDLSRRQHLSKVLSGPSNANRASIPGVNGHSLVLPWATLKQREQPPNRQVEDKKLVRYAEEISDEKWETNDLSRRQHINCILQGASCQWSKYSRCQWTQSPVSPWAILKQREQPPNCQVEDKKMVRFCQRNQWCQMGD